MGIWFALLLVILLSIGVGVFALSPGRFRRKSLAPGSLPSPPGSAPQACFLLWPGCWLVLKTRNLFTVQTALGLHNPKPCSWLDGLAGHEQLFISPPVRGWILVTGSGFPDPCEDADACFRFILELSRKVGHVQCFSASRLSHHHAWVKAKHGRVLRAYAWAGKTLWNQGPVTRAEKKLALKCYPYADAMPDGAAPQAEQMEANVDKVPLLAALWSFDPIRIGEHLLQKESGIAGEPARWY